MKKTLVCLLLVSLLSFNLLASAEEPVRLKGLVESGVLADDPGTGPCYQDIVDLTGYELDFEVYDPDQKDIKINMALASGEDYDMIRGASLTQLFTFIENGALAPLNDAIDKYAPELKNAFSEDVWKAFTMDDGNIYCIPSTSMPRLWNGMVIREDWLDAVGMDMPRTTDDLLNFMRAVKEQDPGKVGADRVVPFSTSLFSGGAIDDDPLLSAFGITYPWCERDGKLVNRIELPEYREWLAYYRTMYEEGLLDKDIAINKNSTLMEKVNKGIVAVARYPWNLTYQTRDAWAAEHPDWKISYMSNPVGPDGEQGIKIENGLGFRFIVPASSKHVDDVVKYANEFVKNYENLMIGTEGVTYEVVDGIRKPILPTFNELRGDTFWYQPVSIGDVEYPLWLMRVYKLESMGQAYSDLMTANENLQKINPIANALNLPVTNTNAASLQDLELTYVLKIIVGELPLDAVDTLIDEWNAKGGAASTEEINAWYASANK